MLPARLLRDEVVLRTTDEAGQGDEGRLEIEVWAESPLLFSPVAMDIDARGRIWVTEGMDYNQRPRVSSGQSIVVLTDSDGDGPSLVPVFFMVTI